MITDLRQLVSIRYPGKWLTVGSAVLSLVIAALAIQSMWPQQMTTSMWSLGVILDLSPAIMAGLGAFGAWFGVQRQRVKIDDIARTPTFSPSPQAIDVIVLFLIGCLLLMSTIVIASAVLLMHGYRGDWPATVFIVAMLFNFLGTMIGYVLGTRFPKILTVVATPIAIWGGMLIIHLARVATEIPLNYVLPFDFGRAIVAFPGAAHDWMLFLVTVAMLLGCILLCVWLSYKPTRRSAELR